MDIKSLNNFPEIQKVVHITSLISPFIYEAIFKSTNRLCVVKFEDWIHTRRRALANEYRYLDILKNLKHIPNVLAFLRYIRSESLATSIGQILILPLYDIDLYQMQIDTSLFNFIAKQGIEALARVPFPKYYT